MPQDLEGRELFQVSTASGSHGSMAKTHVIYTHIYIYIDRYRYRHRYRYRYDNLDDQW